MTDDTTYRHSYLELSVMPELRHLVLSPLPAVLFSSSLSEILWSNAAGAVLFGGKGVFDLLAMRIPERNPIVRQLRMAVDTMGDDHSVVRGFRFGSGKQGSLLQFEVTKVELPSGEHALRVVHLDEDMGMALPEVDSAERVVASLERFAAASAVIDGRGTFLAVSPDFAALAPDTGEIAELAGELQDTPERILKRITQSGHNASIALGLAKFQDNPVRSLLVIATEDWQVTTVNSPTDETPVDEDLADASGASIEDTGHYDEAETANQELSAGENLEAEPDVASQLADPIEPSQGFQTGLTETELTQLAQFIVPVEPQQAGIETGFGHSGDAVEDHADLDGTATPTGEAADNIQSFEQALEDFQSLAPQHLDETTAAPEEVSSEALENIQPAHAAETAVQAIEEAKPEQAESFKDRRFSWALDADRRFITTSETLTECVGAEYANIAGRSWSEIDAEYNLDPQGEVSSLLLGEDSWSGVTIHWPFGDAPEERIATELSGLPQFDSNREFAGFRGTGRFLEDLPESHSNAESGDHASSHSATLDSSTDDARAFEIVETERAHEPADERQEIQQTEIQQQSWLDEALEDEGLSGDLNSSLTETEEPTGNEAGLAAVREIMTAEPDQDEAEPSEANPENFQDSQLNKETANLEETEIADRDTTGAETITAQDNPEYEGVEVGEAEDAIAEDDASENSYSDDDEPEIKIQAVDDAPEETSHKPSALSNVLPFRGNGTEREVLTSDEQAAFFSIRERLKEFSTETSETENEKEKTTARSGETDLLERLPVAVLVYREEEILYVNRQFLAIAEFENIEVLKRDANLDGLLSAMRTDNERGNVVLNKRDGSQITINPVLHTVPWEGEKAALLSFQAPPLPNRSQPNVDISRVEEIQNILDTTSDGIVIMEGDGSIISLNGPAQALFNITYDEIDDLAFEGLFAAESRSAVSEYFDRVAKGTVNPLVNDGTEAIARETGGGYIPVFITLTKLAASGKICAVLRDITHWKKAEEELIQSKQRAEYSSEQKSEFLAQVSHEIRTPLNAIVGFSDVMLEERFGPINNDRYLEYLRDIKRSGAHVLEIVNGLLDLARIEAGKLDLNFEAVDLNELVSEAVALLQPEANSHRKIIRTSLSRSVPKVVADPRSVRQIVLNLVSNAIKYSQSHGQVVVSTVYESNGEVALRVRDAGEGMTQEQIERVLEPFQRGNETALKNIQGSGLGLPLTKALVEANRAFFELESEPGQGTIAHVQFPVQRVLTE